MYISHDLGVIARVSDRVAVLYAGEVVEDATARTVFRTPAHPYARGLQESIPRITVAGIPKSMPGQPPLPGELPGCAFAPRCTYATDICHTDPPGLTDIGNGHMVRCHHWEQVTALDFSKELKESFKQTEKSVGDVAIELTEVEISYYNPGLLDNLLKIEPPPATVSNVNLTVRRGETVALVGESGSGKSTIVRTISGLLPARDGHIRFDKYDLTV